ncbi:MAG: ribonuclease HII [Clostridiales bacterium]|nr:ribonuclease HII [Clostridiales bacterium]
MARLTEAQLIEKYDRLSSYENEYLGQGLELIAGIDEAGRGPLAGPVVAAACVLDPKVRILGLDDSKKLSAKKRDELYDKIIEYALCYEIRSVDADIIDEINILEATKRAMRECVKGLENKGFKPQVLLIDAVKLEGTDVPVIVPIIKGDANSNSIAAASILAKVTRDRMMEEYDVTYPGYGFAAHKGYGTAAHYKAIRELGMCPIHRRSFLKVIH